jgi:hypothetical protein
MVVGECRGGPVAGVEVGEVGGGGEGGGRGGCLRKYSRTNQKRNNVENFARSEEKIYWRIMH